MRASVLLEELVDAAHGLDSPRGEDDIKKALKLPDPGGPAGCGGELPEPPEGADVEGYGGFHPRVVGDAEAGLACGREDTGVGSRAVSFVPRLISGEGTGAGSRAVSFVPRHISGEGPPI